MEIYHKELWSVTCRVWSHSVTCHPTQVNVPTQRRVTYFSSLRISLLRLSCSH